MTIWQSMAMISPAQAFYGLGLIILFWLRGPSPTAWVLLADFIALLAIAGAMDMEWLDPSQSKLSMLVVWVVSTAILATMPLKILAALGAVAVAAFIATIRFDVQMGTTSAIVNAVAFIMLAVALYGLGGDSGGRGRLAVDRPLSVGLPPRDMGMGQAGVAQRAGLLSPDRRGLT